MILRRALSTLLFFLTLLTLFFCLLWQLQLVRGADYAHRSLVASTETESIPAARGKLLDRRGRILAEDETLWTAEAAPKEAVRLAELCREEGIPWSGEGPVEGITPRLLARVKEEGLAGVSFLPVVERRDSGTLAPQLLGRVGKMSQTEWEKYQAEGYAMDETVGKDGAEAAFQDLLRGIPGRRVTERDRAGQVLARHWERLPVPGKDVTLTLDRDLQAAAREALEGFLKEHPAAQGGAAVLLDAEDGGVLAMVSLPDYDPDTLSRDYQSLAADPRSPLLHRAIQGLYAPGSTFKLVTAAAALEAGVLTPETRILDTGRYTYYASPQPQCWLYRQEGRTHGLETVAEAIADSCNVFFYDAGRRVGIQALDRCARRLGLGVPTGIELAGEAAGTVAGPASAAETGGGWYEGSVLSAAIGQENNRFTPLQLARMCSLLVGGEGQVHLLKRAEGLEGTENRREDGFSLAPENLAAIKAGMGAVTRNGSLAAAFRDLPVTAGAKTGSAQVEGKEASNAVLVAFAPYDRPRVALALVAEQGGGGAALGPAAAEILSAWAKAEGKGLSE